VKKTNPYLEQEISVSLVGRMSCNLGRNSPLAESSRVTGNDDVVDASELLE